MPVGYRAALALTSLLLFPAAASAAKPAPRPPHVYRLRELYSARALRHARNILQLRLLERRRRRLRRVYEALQRRLPVGELLRLP